MSRTSMDFQTLVRSGALEIGDGYRAKNDELGKGGPIFLRSAYLQDIGFVLGDPERFSSDVAPRFGQKIAVLNDVVITTKGNSTGRVGRIGRNEVGAVYSPHLSYWRSRDGTRIDQDFLYYWSRGSEFRNQLAGMSTSTDMAPYLSLRDQLSLRITLPGAADQRGIGKALRSLDDKIELNRRMNEMLEAMAQATFRDWFVDFGPVRRKLAGETDPVAMMGGLTPDPGRAADYAAMFPTAFGEEGLPEGWRQRPIGDQAEIAGGSTPSTADEGLWQPGEHRWATPRDLSSMADLALFETGRRISSRGLARITSGLLPAGTVLLSSRAPIGYLAIAQEPVAINQGFIAMKPTADLGSAYLYLWCKANMEAILANANGSTFQEISKKNFRPITSAVPDDPAILRAFGDFAQPLIERIVAAARENRTLAETRDYLLPRLMSGAVRVGDVTQQEAAA